MNDIIIHEVGLRDGLQMEKQIVPMAQKAKWVEQLIDAGVDIIQLGSFVHPEKVPQMADTDGLFQYFTNIERPSGVMFSGLYVTRGFGITAWTHALYDVFLLLLQ